MTTSGSTNEVSVRRHDGPRPGKILLILLGGLIALVAFGTGVAGGAAVWAHSTQRDRAGYFTTHTERLATNSHALVSERIDLGTRVGDRDWVPFDSNEGDVRIRTARADKGDVFIGIARADDVAAYLEGVSYDRVTSVEFAPFDVNYRHVNVGAERAPIAPTESSIWFAEVSGPGTQTLHWDAESGQWTVVVMNADGSPGVRVDTSIGLKTSLLLPIGIGLLVFTGFALLVSLVLLFAGVRGFASGTGTGGPMPTGPTGTTAAHAAGETWMADAPGPVHVHRPVEGAYPARLDGHLDPQLSRWMWLVKWFLAIPHFLVLALLWAAFSVLTLVAGLAVLFTGRYPRSIFDVNVGIMRWSWRVAFYAFTLGTDRYPPFSLHRDPSYPADFDVTYPEHLSRGMVLVKWILALPHYLVLAVFGGFSAGWWQQANDHTDWWLGTGAGLVGLLVFLAAIVLLFTGKYLQGIFDVVMGMERWTFRVYAYVGLMTDQYPPFRFDSGGTDPGSIPAYPPDQPTPPRTDQLVGAPL